MESRKYQLRKQIIEAQKANNNDLYFLLKSQWAHRFGVESLDELNNLDLKDLNQNSIDLKSVLIFAPYGEVNGYSCLAILFILTVGLFFLIRPLLNRKLA